MTAATQSPALHLAEARSVEALVPSASAICEIRPDQADAPIQRVSV